MTVLKAALIQMRVTDNKERNVLEARRLVAACAAEGADLVMLPEMFCCPYQASAFPAYAEPEDGWVTGQLSAAAREHRVILVGGSMPERDAQGKIYNTCFVFDRQGERIARHRKMHLFDIDVTGGQRFQEKIGRAHV